ncbi:MAG: divalent metal cation transporter [Chloroflexota bacterium]
MNEKSLLQKNKYFLSSIKLRLLIFISVFGPATITAMSDNDAAGVATYSIAGAKLGYPILFPLVIITILLGITQEMGMRLTLVTRRALADLIRERFGVRASLFMFSALFIANIGTIIVDLAAVKTTSSLLHLPEIPFLLFIILFTYLFVTKGNYKLTQSIMLLSSLLYVAYIFSAIQAKPDWGLALSNLIYPHGPKGMVFDNSYLKDFLLIGMGVLGTTITPWGQFFVSSFAGDKAIEKGKILYSQIETYLGALLTDFFSFFMIIATAATLYVNGITIESGEQAAMAIKPFAGELASTLFAIGILNAGFMGIVVISLSTAYAFSEFFGLSGSLDTDFKQSKIFYSVFLIQLVIAGIATLIPGVSLFNLAVLAQTINAMALPVVFYYLIRLTSDKKLMGDHRNTSFQKYFTTAASILIVIASIFTVIAIFIKF